MGFKRALTAAAEKEKAEGYLKRLSGYLNVEKCTECECLQGLLSQLRIDHPEMKRKVNQLASKRLHGCYGCNPCPPAEIWSAYGEEKDSCKR